MCGVCGIGLGVLDCVLNALGYTRVHFVKSKRKFLLNGVERFELNGLKEMDMNGIGFLWL